MASSCNKHQDLHDHKADPQHRHQHLQQHTFTTNSHTKPFHKRSLLVFVVLALSVSLKCILCEEYAETTTADTPITVTTTIFDIDSELSKNTTDALAQAITADKQTSPQLEPDVYHDVGLDIVDSQTDIPALENKDNQTFAEESIYTEDSDVNNDIFAENDTTHSLSSILVPKSFEVSPADSTELEQIIRKSVKTEIEMEQGLEPSPVLEILKDISEPEIRETLSQDLNEPALMRNNVESTTEKSDELKDSSISEDQLTQNLELHVEVPNEDSAREARNLEDQNSNDTSESLLSSLESDNSNESNHDHQVLSSESNGFQRQNEEAPKHSQEDIEYVKENTENQQVFDTNNDRLENHVGKLATSIVHPAESRREIEEPTTTTASDVALLENEDSIGKSDENDDALSVVLDESLSSTVPINEDETLKEIEEAAQKTSLDIIAEEETTAMPDDSEHVVIKKVLDVNDIFIDVPETTIQPELVTEREAEVIIEVPHPTVIVEDFPAKPEANENENNEEQIMNADIYDGDGHNSNDADIKVDKKEVESASKHYNSEEEDQTDIDVMSSTTETIDFNDSSTENQKAGDDAELSDSGTEMESKDISATTEFNRPISEQISEEVPTNHFYIASTTVGPLEITEEIPMDGFNNTNPVKGSRSVNTALIDDDAVATMFETYPPQDAGQTFNGNLADESAGIGKALPVSVNDGSNRSTTIIILSSGTAFLFIVISVTIFLISFQRQHGTLDIEMQERSCGKDNLEEEDAETFAKLLDVELPPSVAIALEETEECL
uniref:Uncharacterized protein n=1 Tax=Musca domestica TaxID=7370 RepID=A0A1I8NDZ9_MUSDO